MSIPQKLLDLLYSFFLGEPAPVMLQDQDTTAFDLYLTQEIDGPFTLNSPTVQDSRDVEVVTPHSFAAVGDGMFIFDGQNVMQVCVTAITLGVGFDTIEVDTPIDKAFQIADTEIYEETREMDVDGSATRQIFRVPAPVMGTTPVIFDIVRIMFFIAASGAMDDGKFGDLATLANGVVFRQVTASGNITSYFNFKDNGAFYQIAYDAIYTDKGPAGDNGFRSRLTYAGPHKHGVVLRINPGDRLELVIQDDLTGLSIFHATVGGHIAN